MLVDRVGMLVQTSRAVCSLEASKEICSLEEQLHSVASQRDSLTMQLSNAQEQCSQYAVQLQNLQLVLEQFQRGKTEQPY